MYAELPGFINIRANNLFAFSPSPIRKVASHMIHSLPDWATRYSYKKTGSSALKCSKSICYASNLKGPPVVLTLSITY